MNLSELKAKLHAASFHPVHVEDDMNEVRGLKFSGSLEEYLEALTALGKTVIFIAAQKVDDDDFQYDLSERTYDDEEEEFQYEVEKINLCAVNTTLEKFKERIGQVCVFKLLSSISEDSLTFYIEADWWDEFSTIYADAVQTVVKDKMTIQERIEAAQKEKIKELIKTVRELRRDEDFIDLRTQRAMLAYAKEKIPELENIDASLLRKEIQALYDKLRG
jgi:hypothetical protein